MNKMTIRDLDVQGKRVLMRVDFNVPVADGKVTDDTRITAALPSINYVLENGGSLILMSHCGRPKGEKNPEFTLKPAADRLAELVNAKVTLAPDVIGPQVEKLVDELKEGEIRKVEVTFKEAGSIELPFEVRNVVPPKHMQHMKHGNMNKTN